MIILFLPLILFNIRILQMRCVIPAQVKSGMNVAVFVHEHVGMISYALMAAILDVNVHPKTPSCTKEGVLKHLNVVSLNVVVEVKQECGN